MYQAPAVPTPASVVLLVSGDIGQRIDPTAICVAEQITDRYHSTEFYVRYLQRLPLGTSYPDVARRFVEVLTGAIRRVRSPRYADGSGELPAGWVISNGFDFRLDVYASLDVTGVGRPVADLITAAIGREPLASFRANLEIQLVTFTYGQRITYSPDGERRVGKAYLVSRLQALLHSSRIHLPLTSEAQALTEELMGFEIRVDPDGDARFGAFSTGKHDDLVTALGLAVLEDRLPDLDSGTICGYCSRLRSEHHSCL